MHKKTLLTIVYWIAICFVFTTGYYNLNYGLAKELFFSSLLVPISIKYLLEYIKAKEFLKKFDHKNVHQVFKKHNFYRDYLIIFLLLLPVYIAFYIDQQTGKNIATALAVFQCFTSVGIYLIKRNLNYYGIYITSDMLLLKSFSNPAGRFLKLNSIARIKEKFNLQIIINHNKQLILIALSDYENSIQLNSWLKGLKGSTTPNHTNFPPSQTGDQPVSLPQDQDPNQERAKALLSRR